MLSAGDFGVMLCSHQKQSDSELSVSNGDMVQVVLVSSDNKWAWCRSPSNEEGFVPFNYIGGNPVTLHQQAGQSPTQRVQVSPSPNLSDSSELSQDYFFPDNDSPPALPQPSVPVYEDDSQQRRCYRVLGSFVGSSPQDLSVSQGELVLGNGEPGQSRRWVYSCRLQGGSGYVPKNMLILASDIEAKPWFLGQISRTDTEDILKETSLPMGTFIVRESNTLDGFVISYKDLDDTSRMVCVKHRKINFANSSYYAWESYNFANLVDLVETHLTDVGNNLLRHPYDKSACLQTCSPERRQTPPVSRLLSRPLPAFPNQSLPIPPPPHPVRPLSPKPAPLLSSTNLVLTRPRQPPPPIPKRKPLLLPLSPRHVPKPPSYTQSTSEQTDQVYPAVALRSHQSGTLGRFPQQKNGDPGHFQPLAQVHPDDDITTERRSSRASLILKRPPYSVRPTYALPRNVQWDNIANELENLQKMSSQIRECSNESETFNASQTGVELGENESPCLEGSQSSSVGEQEWCLPPLLIDEDDRPPTPEPKPDLPPRPASRLGTITRGQPNRGEWYIDGSQVEKEEKLGSGYYGEVWKVMFTRLDTNLAMKTLNPNTMHVSDFLMEAEVMKDLRHPNLVKLYGVCTDESFAFMLIEYYPNGSVSDFFKRGGILSERQKLEIIKNVAAGMKYLSELNYIHRDLAARNVLLADDLTARVADFGLAQLIKGDDSQRTSNLKMPWKWTAPEALCGRNEWSPLCDVWSYGVFCWELYSNCSATPYSGIGNSRELLNFLSGGGKLSKPAGCSDMLYSKLMLRCWIVAVPDRITFEDIVGFLKYNEVVQEGWLETPGNL